MRPKVSPTPSVYSGTGAPRLIAIAYHSRRGPVLAKKSPRRLSHRRHQSGRSLPLLLPLRLLRCCLLTSLSHAALLVSKWRRRKVQSRIDMHCIPITPAKQKKQRLCTMWRIRDRARAPRSAQRQCAHKYRDRAHSLQNRRVEKFCDIAKTLMKYGLFAN